MQLIDLYDSDQGVNLDSAPLNLSQSSQVLQDIQRGYYHETRWEVPLPRVPAVPILLRNKQLDDAWEIDEGTAVMQSEVFAMKVGALEAVRLAHVPVAPGEVRKAIERVEQQQQEFEEVQKRWVSSGNLPKLVWSAMERNAHLPAEDAALLDTDVDADILEKKAMPSLSLLKRPLYTEIGLTSPESRHLERMNRLVPPALQSHSQLLQSSAPLGAADSGAAGGSGGGLFGANSDIFDEAGMAASQRAAATAAAWGRGVSEATSAATNGDGDDAWWKGINASFQFASGVDKQFREMLDRVANEKLGLAGVPQSPAATRPIAAAFWKLLFSNTGPTQQRCIWAAMCAFARDYLASSDASNPTRSVVPSLEDLKPILPSENEGEWSAWLTDYYAALQQTVDVRKAKKSLNVTEADVSVPARVSGPVPFLPDVATKEKSGYVRRVSRASRSEVYAVEVLPVFPSGHENALKRIREHNTPELERSRLGTRARDLHHVLVRNAQELLPRSDTFHVRPHIVVNNNTIMTVEDRDPNAGVSVASETIQYRTNELHCVEKYLHDKDDHSFALFDVHDTFVTYDQIFERSEYRRSASSVAPNFSRYVVAFGDEDDDDIALEQDAKRRRKEVSA